MRLPNPVWICIAQCASLPVVVQFVASVQTSTCLLVFAVMPVYTPALPHVLMEGNDALAVSICRQSLSVYRSVGVNL